VANWLAVSHLPAAGFGMAGALEKALLMHPGRLIMKSSLIRTAIATSLVTAIAASALTLFAFPRLMNSSNTNDSPYTAQPAVNNAPAAQDDTYVTPPPHARLRRAYYQAPSYSQPTYSQPVYSQPVVRQHRSLGKSVLIVAGSSAAGAGIGGLAGGKKGAGIGAIAGGIGGLIYDRMTANKH